MLEAAGSPVPEVAELVDLCHRWAEQLAPYLADTAPLLHRWIQDGKAVLFEGAQGALLDVDHGTYPFGFRDCLEYCSTCARSED